MLIRKTSLNMSEAIVFTSGKGGVGKTTLLANIGVALSILGFKTVLLDADIGLRNQIGRASCRERV